MKTLSSRVISILLCLNLLINSFLPLVIYAREAEDSGDSGSGYSEDTPPAETAPAEEPQEDINTLRQEQRDLREGHESSIYTPGPTPEPTSAPAPETTPEPTPEEVITTPTAQERALERYASRAEAMDQYQDEVYANTRTDQQGSGTDVTYAPSKITGMVQSQLDRVEEKINEIAESITPMSREEVLQQRRLERKEEQLNKLAEQSDAALEAAEEEKRKQLELAMNLTPEDREVYLKETGIIPADTPAEQVDAKVRTAAAGAGFEIDGSVVSGDFTISNVGFGCQPGAEDGCRNVSLADLQAVGEFGLDTVMQGTYYLGKKALDLQGDMDKVDRLLGEAGLANRQQLSPISGPGSLAGGYGVTLIRLQELAKDVDAHPDNSLTPEEQAKRKEYTEALRTLWEEQHQVALDTAATAALNFVGAPLKIAKAGAAKVIPQSVQKAAGEAGNPAWNWVSSKVGGLFGKGAKEGGEAVEEVAESVFIKTEGKAAGVAMAQSPEVTKKLRMDLGDAREIYSDQEIAEARSLVQEVMGFTPSDDTVAIVVDALNGAKRIPPEVVKERLSRVKEIVSYQEKILGSQRDNAAERVLVKAPPDTDDNVFIDDWDQVVGVKDTWNTFRYKGVGTQSFGIMKDGKGFTRQQLREEFAPDLLDASLEQYSDAQRVIAGGTIQKAQEKFSKFKETVISLGGNESTFQGFDPKKIVDPDKIMTVDRDTMSYLIPSHTPGHAAGGFYDGSTNMVVTQRNAGFSTECHEWCHVMQKQLGSSGVEREMKIALGLDANKKSNGGKLLEGLNEIANQVVQNESVPAEFLSSSALPTGNEAKWIYQPQVSAVHDQVIPLVLEQNPGMNREKAWVLVLEASAGRYDKLISAAGGGNAKKGAKALNQIYNKVEPIFSDPGGSIKVSRAITPVDAAGAIGGAIAIGAGAVGGVVLLDQATKPQPTVNPSPRQLPLRLIQDAHAAESENNPAEIAFDIDSFESLVKYNLVKQALEEDGSVESDYVEDVAAMDIIEPEVLKLNSGYLLTTGKAGTVEGNFDKNKYIVEVSAIPNLDIKMPSYIDVSSGDAILGIAVKEGSGKVEKVGSAGGRDDINFSLVKTAYAQESNSAKVKVVVFADNNGNGVIDNEEKVLPWAGVSVKLTKVIEENTANLNAGWNLVSLTLLPNQTLTASTLLKEIADQDGQTTTVSTLVDGAWKSYVKRGENDYSMDDFAIEVDKSYFIKALKPSIFKYSGQNLVSPVKLSLKSGWNAVGFPKTSKEYKASSLIEAVSASGTMAWWDSGLWDTFVKKEQEEYGNNFAIFPSFGYIIKVDKEEEVTP